MLARTPNPGQSFIERQTVRSGRGGAPVRHSGHSIALPGALFLHSRTARRQQVRSKPVSDTEARHPRQLRRVNRDRVLAATMGHPGPLTRAADHGRHRPVGSRRWGASPAELLKLGLLNELGRGPSTGGRRPRSLQFNAQYGVVAGIVFDAATTRLAVADLAGETLAASEAKTPHDEGPERLLSWMGGQIRTLLSTTGGAQGRAAARRHRGAPGSRGPRARDGRGPDAGLPELGEPGGGGVPREAGRSPRGRGERRQAGRSRRALAGCRPGSRHLRLHLSGSGHRRGDPHRRRAPPRPSLAGGRDRGHVHGLRVPDPGLRDPRLPGDPRGLRHDPPTLATGSARGPPDLARALLRAAQAGEEAALRAIGDAATLIGMAAANLSLVIDPSLLVLSGPLVGNWRGRAGAGAQRRLPDHPPAPEGRVLGPGRRGDARREPSGGDSGGPWTPAPGCFETRTTRGGADRSAKTEPAERVRPDPKARMVRDPARRGR